MNLENNMGMLLAKASRLLSNKLNNRLVKHNLTSEQWSLLATLWNKDHQKQKDLEQILLKNKATINSLVSYLIKSEFIEKNQSIVDKRSFIISLTKKGKDIKPLTLPLAQQSITEAKDGINPDDLKTTLKVLNQIINNLTQGKL